MVTMTEGPAARPWAEGRPGAYVTGCPRSTLHEPQGWGSPHPPISGLPSIQKGLSLPTRAWLEPTLMKNKAQQHRNLNGRCGRRWGGVGGGPLQASAARCHEGPPLSGAGTMMPGWGETAARTTCTHSEEVRPLGAGPDTQASGPSSPLERA